MAIEALSAREQDIVLRCLRATAAYIEDWEKHSRLGIGASDLQQVIAQWPNIDDRDGSSTGFLAINNSMNEVCHGFEIGQSEWGIWFDMPMSDVESAYQRWLRLTGTAGGIR